MSLVVAGYGDSHVGSVRDTNEDALIVDGKWGLYAVLDGMGGASAGDVASTKARDVIHEYVRARRSALGPRQLLEAAINAASAAVHGEAQRRRDRRGMGTTVVACLIDGRRATVAHVGDSRAYLLRDGRLHRLTNDHTIVAELVARGAIQPDEADRHAYKNVLSRNLGAKATAAVDINEIELQAGDRLMLCSDGLYGYAASEAMHQLIASTDPAADVVRDLIDAALRGGGGDNVTAILIDAGTQLVPRATVVLRTSGAGAWWARRDRLLAAARAHGIHRSPLCAVLAPDDAIALVAGNFADAVYHDLEKATSVNVWSFAENLAVGWLGQGGAWLALRELLDGLGRSADTVIGELRAEDPALAALIEAALARALVTAETAVGGVLAQRLRTVEAELVRHDAARARQFAFHPAYAIYEPGFLRLGAGLHWRCGCPAPVYRFMFTSDYSFGFPPEDYAMTAYLRLLDQFAPGAQWMVGGLGVDVLPLIPRTVMEGGHVRVGLEDMSFGTDRSNVELVEAAVTRIDNMGGTLADAASVRAALTVEV